MPLSYHEPPAPFAFSVSSAQSRAKDTEALAAREDNLLGRLSTLLKQTGAAPEDLQLLEQTRSSLSEVFLLVLLGEFNAGKTSFINVLLGDKILEEGVTPTTSEITRITYGKSIRKGEDYSLSLGKEGHPQEVQLPVEWLRYVNVVDTPGTNAVLEKHQKITEEFLPRCDFVVFLTSSDRPLSQSERGFLEKIRGWKKKLVVVLTKRDQVESPAELDIIQNFVDTNLRSLLGLNPPVFAVSSRVAQRLQRRAVTDNGSITAEDLQKWEESGFPELYAFLQKQLDCDERAKIKLETPLDIAQRLADQYLEVVRSRADTLQKDMDTLASLEQQQLQYVDSMKEEFQMQLTQVKIVMEALRLRGRNFISRSFSLRNLATLLLRSSAFAAEFKAEVVRDNSRSVDQAVKHVCDWITSNNSRQMKRSMTFLASSSEFNVTSITHELDLDFSERRSLVLTRISETVNRLLESDAQRTQADQLLSSIKNSIYQALVVEAGAASIAALFAASLLDISGVGIAAVLAAAGAVWLPYKQRQVATDFEDATSALSKSIEVSVSAHLDSELADAMSAVRNACSPFAAFIEAESKRLQLAEDTLLAGVDEISTIRRDILASCDLLDQAESDINVQATQDASKPTEENQTATQKP